MSILYGIDARAFEFWCPLSVSLSSVQFPLLPHQCIAMAAWATDYHIDQSLGQLVHLPPVELLLCHQLVNHLKDEPGRGPRWRCITPSQWSTRSGLERGCWKSMDMKRKLAL